MGTVRRPDVPVIAAYMAALVLPVRIVITFKATFLKT
jgi:hypothetical protein